MLATLDRLKREITSLDGGRLTVQVEGTFLFEEITQLLGKRDLTFQLKQQLGE